MYEKYMIPSYLIALLQDALLSLIRTQKDIYLHTVWDVILSIW